MAGFGELLPTAVCGSGPGLDVLELALALFFGSSGSFDSAAATATAPPSVASAAVTATAALRLARTRLPARPARARR